MARQSYLKNAAILTGTGLLLRAAGSVLRIYIAARIGAEGMGLYELIYTVYTMAVTLATAGLSVAATRLSAELLATDDPANARAAMRRTLALGLWAWRGCGRAAVHWSGACSGLVAGGCAGRAYSLRIFGAQSAVYGGFGMSCGGFSWRGARWGRIPAHRSSSRSCASAWWRCSLMSAVPQGVELSDTARPWSWAIRSGVSCELGTYGMVLPA